MPTTILGLPLHALIIHATVVLVPTAAAAVIASAASERFRRWVGWGTLALTLLAVVLVPITTSTGEALEHALPRNALIERHAHLADGLLPWVIGLAVTTAFLTGWRWWSARQATAPALPAWVLPVVRVLSVIAAVGTIVEVVIIGHAGATATWSGVVSG